MAPFIFDVEKVLAKSDQRARNFLSSEKCIYFKIHGKYKCHQNALTAAQKV